MKQARIAQLARGLQLIANETDGEDVRSSRVIVDMPNQALHELGRIVGDSHPKDMVKALLDEVIALLVKQSDDIGVTSRLMVLKSRGDAPPLILDWDDPICVCAPCKAKRSQAT